MAVQWICDYFFQHVIIVMTDIDLLIMLKTWSLSIKLQSCAWYFCTHLNKCYSKLFFLAIENQLCVSLSDLASNSGHPYGPYQLHILLMLLQFVKITFLLLPLDTQQHLHFVSQYTWQFFSQIPFLADEINQHNTPSLPTKWSFISGRFKRMFARLLD